MGIFFYSEQYAKIIKNKTLLKKWIKELIVSENKIPGNITFIFTDDDYLSELNKQYLKHNTLTDIITFDYTAENKGKISGDIFISITRVEENAVKFKVPFNQELNRVMAHGVLHLIGYRDKTKAEKQLMRQKEDNSLSLLKKLN
jgi:rRNA maturation RNase YbeY